jgi:hypothetical protein
MVNDPGPLFLAGVDRSGIGLLGELLEAHPNIAVTRRTNFWTFYYEQYGDLRKPGNLGRCISEMMRNTRIQALHPDRERLTRDFQEGEATYPRLFALLQQQNLRRLDKSRWCDKSLNSEGYAGIIMSAYPTARMIQVIRDPRDRYISQATHRQAGRGKVGSGAALWRWSARLAEHNRQKYPDRYFVVRYETLVDRPEATLAELCDFIGEEYSDDMLLTDTGPRPITAASVGRFRRDLSGRDLLFLQLATGRMAARFGYEPATVQLSGRDRLAFWFADIPLNATRLWLWQPWSALRRRIRTGPSNRRLVDPG